MGWDGMGWDGMGRSKDLGRSEKSAAAEPSHGQKRTDTASPWEDPETRVCPDWCLQLCTAEERDSRAEPCLSIPNYYYYSNEQPLIYHSPRLSTPAYILAAMIPTRLLRSQLSTRRVLTSPGPLLRIPIASISSETPHEDKKGRENGKKRPKVIIVGAGWAGYRVAYDLDKNLFDVMVVSPRNHFLFTPLLPSTTVGTLEFRAIQEPVRTIPGLHYYQAEVTSIDFDQHRVHCSDIYKSHNDFDLQYDALILAPGSETNTFGVKGVENNENVFYLKQLNHSRAIRNRLIDCFERASSPGVTDPEQKRALLTFVIVGGGPTSVEFAAELYDFLVEDVSRWYEDLLPYTSVKIIETTDHILGAFSSSLVNYVENLFRKRRQIDLVTGTSVKEVRDNVAVLSDGREIPFGLMVWSTGIKQVSFVQSLPKERIAKFPNGRLKTDDFLHLLEADGSAPAGQGRVFGLGDCAGNIDKPLPALAQVAMQQGKYLAASLNRRGLDSLLAARRGSPAVVPPFKYAHLGSLASVGQWKGVYDSPHLEAIPEEVPPVKGFLAFLLWRSAYWTRSVSVVNKVLIPMYWFKAFLFGRDISRF